MEEEEEMEEEGGGSEEDKEEKKEEEELEAGKPEKANSKLNFHLLECVKDVNEGKVGFFQLSFGLGVFERDVFCDCASVPPPPPHGLVCVFERDIL